MTEVHLPSVFFDRIADGYDGPPLRLFPWVADHLVHHIQPRPGEKLLDVGAGTGAVAIAAAQRVGSSGRVFAVDLSGPMLDRAETHAAKMVLSNIDFYEMDGAHLEFRNGYFDHVAGSFALQYLDSPEAALRSWLRVLRPGGTIAFTSFGTDPFSPLAGLLRSHLEEGGYSAGAPLPWDRLTDPAACATLLERAGAVEVAAEQRPMGYHLNNALEWWEVVEHTDLALLLDGLDGSSLQALRERHFPEVNALDEGEGIAVEVPVNIVSGRKPET